MYLDNAVRCDVCRSVLGVPDGQPAVALDPRAKAAADAGWDWFCGHLPATVHACPRCQRGRESEVQALRRAADARPAAARPAAGVVAPECKHCPGRRAVARGVCQRCYQRYAKRARGGETTWERLESCGAVDPPKK